MSDTKFTPGPWQYVHIEFLTASGHYITTATDNNVFDEKWVAKVRSVDADCNDFVLTEESVANANLIAAAPDLYAALKGLLDAYTQSDESYCDCREDHGEGFPCPACIGRAALAKARGEQP